MKNYPWLKIIFQTKDSAATILIRILVSVVFIPEGIQKLTFSGMLGSEHISRIEIPYANIFGPFVGSIEVTCGLLILLGLITRIACIPLILTMIIAILSTKIPILLVKDWWIFHAQTIPHYNFWNLMHELRGDISMLFASGYLLIRGAGTRSLDAWIYEVCSIEHHQITEKH